jgi:molecular chaperone Hsp33
MSDEIVRFIFDHTDIRGEWVQLEQSYQDCLANHHHAPSVRRLLGEFMAAAGLLSATLKFDGAVILQVRGDGEVPLIMAEAGSDNTLRAIVHAAGHAASDDFRTLLGREGRLAITIDPRGGQRYQGIVPLEGTDLASCLEHYFHQSEQLPTRLWLAADGRRAAGLLLQELPSRAGPEQRAQQWQHLATLAATLTPAELLGLPAAELLHRLFHQESLRVLRRDELQFRCSCSQARTELMLVRLGRAELEDILREQGRVEVICEFCNQQYRFAPDAVAQLFDSADPARH